MDAIRLLQDGAFSTWIRESSWAIFAFLIVHSLSMGFLAGTGAAIGLRVLGVAPGVPLSRAPGLFPIMWTALAAALVSGALLVSAYPAKALTNPVFYIKLGLAVAAGVMTAALARRLFGDPRYDLSPSPGWARWMGAAIILCWAGSIIGGRFLAYTHKMLLVY